MKQDRRYKHTHRERVHRVGGGERGGLIYYEKLAHGIVKSERSHDLLSTSWRLREADAVFRVSSKD